MALQHGLGLLPEWRAGPGLRGVAGPGLVRPGLSDQNSKNAIAPGRPEASLPGAMHAIPCALTEFALWIYSIKLIDTFTTSTYDPRAGTGRQKAYDQLNPFLQEEIHNEI